MDHVRCSAVFFQVLLVECACILGSEDPQKALKRGEVAFGIYDYCGAGAIFGGNGANDGPRFKPFMCEWCL